MNQSRARTPWTRSCQVCAIVRATSLLPATPPKESCAVAAATTSIAARSRTASSATYSRASLAPS